MEDVGLLELASATFRARMAEVGEDQQFLSTPCEDWNVAGLITHVIGGDHMAARLLQGAHRAEAIGYLSGLPLGDDPLATYDEHSEAQLEAFREPGAMERICEHPMGDLPGSMIIQLRIGDLTLHSWDLARAVGGDEELPDELVAVVWERMDSLRDNVAASGLFGEGPSGEVGEDAPLQMRLLDLTGRRP